MLSTPSTPTARLLFGASQVKRTESGHYVQVEQPELVIAAIEQVLHLSGGRADRPPR